MLSTTILMIAAFVALAGVVVGKLVTMELLAVQRRRSARFQGRLVQLESELRAARRHQAAVERERRSLERRRHRLNVKLAHAHEQIGLHEFDESCRQAHFDLLTMHVVER